MAGSNLSKILLIGGTGYIGKFIAEASVKAGHPAFVLTRESTLTNPAKSSIINKFKDLSVNLVILCTKMGTKFESFILVSMSKFECWDMLFREISMIIKVW